jgi:hypothetical protein
MPPVNAFAVRLADLLATLEAVAVLGAAERRVRGLSAMLQFACLAVPCEEALVAIELEQLGRLHVPGVASTAAWRQVDLEIVPSGTPFAFLFGGGSGYAAELSLGDPMLEALGGVLTSAPRYGIFVPIRLGAAVIGGAALFRNAVTMGDRELTMAERLAEVLSGSIEAFRTERVLLELFATLLPELCSPEASTGFARGLERYIHGLRLGGDYRRRLELASAVARLVQHGPNEAILASELIERVERYVTRLSAGQGEAEDGEPQPLSFA